MSWHRDREDSATEADRERASRRVQSAPSPLGAAPDRSLEPAGNGALTQLLRSGRLPAPPSALAPAGNAAVARLMDVATVQRAELPAQDAGPLNPETAAAIDAERGGGAPLPDGIRTEMEGHLGIDLGAVRVHTGQQADTLNRAVNAQAFTSGADVFFSAGTYNPTSSSGRELLAHELTHAAQQAGGTADTGARVSHPADAAEVEARDVAQRVMRSAPGQEPVRESVPGTVARRPATGLVARGPAGAPTPPPAPRQAPALWQDLADPDTEKKLRGQTRARIMFSYDEFSDACSAHVDRLKALAKAQAEAVMVVVDVVAGALSPVLKPFAKGLVDDALNTRLMKEVLGTTWGQDVTALIGNDFIKAGFASVTKQVNSKMKDEIKEYVKQRFDESDEEQFLKGLKRMFRNNAEYLAGEIEVMEGPQLLPLWVAYDSTVANEDTYKLLLDGLLTRFRQVQQISHREVDFGATVHDTRAYYIVANGKRALGLVFDDSASDLTVPGGVRRQRQFYAWVTDPEFEKMAVEKTKKEFGEVREISGEEVVGIKTMP